MNSQNVKRHIRRSILFWSFTSWSAGGGVTAHSVEPQLPAKSGWTQTK